MVWKDITIGENKYSGQHTDGKFGLDLFEGKAVVIDFEKKIIIVRKDLPKIKGCGKLKLTTDREFMFIDAGIETAGPAAATEIPDSLRLFGSAVTGRCVCSGERARREAEDRR